MGGNGDQFLRDLAQRFRDAPARVHADMARRCERAVHDLIDEQFRTGTDPFGRPWEPPKDGHSPPMVRTRKLWGGLKIRVDATGSGIQILVASAAEYARYLQYGTWRMLPRRIVPGSGVLVAAWRAALRAACAAAMARWYSGG